jgi:hypothetical protein
LVKVNIDCSFRDANHPEHIVRVDVHVVVVDLLRNAGLSDRTGVEVKSDKDVYRGFDVRKKVFSRLSGGRRRNRWRLVPDPVG